MKFEQVLENIGAIGGDVGGGAVSTGDVQGLQSGYGVVRRKVGVSRTPISSVKKKKKKKKNETK